VLRTPIAVTAAALAAVTALTACGPVQMGAAAVLGNQTISSATLTREVANLESAYQASKGRITLQFPQSQMTQEVLAWLVRFQIRERLAAREHIDITPAQSQSALAVTAAQIRANGQTLRNVAIANGLPPDLLPELGRFQAIQTALMARLAGGKVPAAGPALSNLQLKFSQAECLAAKSMAIRVNPQYGEFNYTQESVVPAATTLSAPEGGIVKLSPAPRTTPPC
jgi:hypothetical protein